MTSLKTPIAENADGTERQVKLGPTRARAGSKDRDVLVVLVISTVLAIAALLGALAIFSGGLKGWGSQTMSPTDFDNPPPSQAAPNKAPTLP